MIRINLLESAQKKKLKRRGPTGTSLILLYGMLLMLEGLLLYYWSTTKDDALAAQTKLTQEVQKKVEELKKLTDQKTELEKKMGEEKTQAEIFDKLHYGTVGPGNLLLYLSYLLTTPPLANHSERVVQEQIGWNTQWDPDRAWFTSIKEGKENKVVISGEAISHHDTDEVLRRLRTCIYLQGVRFVSAKLEKKEKEAAPRVQFTIEAYLNWNPNVGKEAPKKDKEADKKGKAGEGNKGKAADTKGATSASPEAKKE